ncbi:MAG: 50S ribosomal protein L21 [Candidatus Yonathbacteria bacterium CG_4_10_14_3_um_filter_47_65]|uniref:Large ribosomal subunit protein bL21 n=2 Tax=Parcubacteria group TaxID=1794811 RepID=A0A2M8D7Z0_9BACT|nr:MAG: 50S ribosomal protein L21 [Candidatus Nomurabacteria bacterium CG1_02_47_685]PIP03601.1 MAG: 50S ribosomal protein L21 [Candidatus Yonathbacteria bacterium CG23_combo_of_CG06-09_8_20_14_all_46_18]PIQ31968.1 MAG: 50S ribosomal protein L21 [Candidatus Yonathbacteria bacterium CG17_big_fil_post_rev_8_21_14_2_50_46_19]PIX56338.1 MAG: 50S ribosomal protein L21 [Candidatus Yonathbacteria bacterium CG_4_10_14_3_um_filter_47_65]PIY57527.1 MAG: 50S ribosomal protein L21 [Candidatus Yonathbacteri
MNVDFAVIETGGKQYKVFTGTALTTEKLPGDYKKGDTVVFDKVLLFDDGKKTVLGTPYIKGAKIEAAFEETGKKRKVTVIKYKQKSRYFKKRGHRQPYSKVTIASVSAA